MGTKRPFEEDLQEFIKHPKHLEDGNKPVSFGEVDGGSDFIHTDDGQKSEKLTAVSDMADMELEANASLALMTGISGHEEDPRPGTVLCSNPFPEFFEFNMPRRQLVHHDDTYSSLLNGSPRKDIPVGSEHQADVPEFDPKAARNHNINKCDNISENEEERSSFETLNIETECKCVDSGSIRCVQQHVKESRMKLRDSLGLEKFANLGLHDMGEEVSGNWTEAEEQLFQDVVYSNPVSLGRKFWEQLAVAFPSRTKKELVSYYYNVFILRRRAVQNRSNLLEIDSDDDEWWGSRRGVSGIIEHRGFVVLGSFDVHGDHDSSPEEINEHEHEHEDKVTNESGQEKPINTNTNRHEAENGGLRSEAYLHWDPPYSTMGSTKGVDLLPTCSMIEEIFGSSKTGKST